MIVVVVAQLSLHFFSLVIVVGTVVFYFGSFFSVIVSFIIHFFSSSSFSSFYCTLCRFWKPRYSLMTYSMIYTYVALALNPSLKVR